MAEGTSSGFVERVVRHWIIGMSFWFRSRVMILGHFVMIDGSFRSWIPMDFK